MRVDTPADNLQLSFTTSPGGILVQSDVVFSVTAPAEDSPGKLVTFKLAGIYQDVVVNYDSFVTAVQEHLGQQLDIDVSRITRLKVCGAVISHDVIYIHRYRHMMAV